MHRFYLPPSECRSQSLTLTGREAHHALHVVRVRRGDRVSVLDGAGGVFHCEVDVLGRDTVRLAVVEKQVVAGPECNVTLLQALPKGKIFDAILQKATELGASRIVPLLSERVTIQLDAQGASHRAEKWQQVAIEAIKQCGAAWLPKVERPVSPVEFLAQREHCELPLIASLQAGRRHPKEIFAAFEQQHGRRPKNVFVWIGPEGDFTPDEVGKIEASGAWPISLGPLVLRVETAAIYCLSILNYEFNAV